MTRTLVNQQSPLFSLVVRQQPCKARLCSFKEKVDRRPIDPPPIIQITSNNQSDDDFLQNPYFFLYATLTDASGETDLHFVNGNRTTAGTVVQSLHKLKDVDNTDGGFFIFSDISVRLEGFYRLKFTLYEIEGQYVNRMCSIISDIFQVYSPKSFPGMSESTFLTRSFSDQGVRIRIRKEPRSSSSANTSHCGKRRRKDTGTTTDGNNSNDSEDDSMIGDGSYMELSPLPRSQQPQPMMTTKLIPVQPAIPYYSNSNSVGGEGGGGGSSILIGRSPSPLPEPDQKHYHYQSYQQQQQHNVYQYHPKNSVDIVRPTLPSPKEIFRSSAMSMQNILSSDHISQQQHQQPSSSAVLFPPTPADDELHTNHTNNNNRLFTTRKLPLPLPSQTQHHSEDRIIKTTTSPPWLP
ncbi:unnamed protein product [Mucor hiemalis]